MIMYLIVPLTRESECQWAIFDTPTKFRGALIKPEILIGHSRSEIVQPTDGHGMNTDLVAGTGRQEHGGKKMERENGFNL